MRIDILTLFPGVFQGWLQESLLKKAIDAGLLAVDLHDFRRWAVDKHGHVDDRPFGGGPGMVLRVEPVVDGVEWVQAQRPEPSRLILLSPGGRRLDQPLVEELAKEERLTLICGRYEGFDQRVVDLLRPEEISIGDYVLNGGEVAAMAIVEAVMRLLPGALGDETSSIHDSFSSGQRWLEHPQYTRPREYRGLSVPETLLSGDHQAIARWRAEQSYATTRRRREDLLRSGDRTRTDDRTEKRNQRGANESPPANDTNTEIERP